MTNIKRIPKGSWKRGFNADARHNEPVDDLFSKFKARCERENLSERTKQWYGDMVPVFIAFLRARKCIHWQDVELPDIQAWIEHTQQRDVSDSYKQSWIRVTKTFLRWIETEGLDGHLEALPVIHQLQGRQYIPSPQILHQFLMKFDRDTVWGFRDYVVCMVIIDCGARIGEICTMSPTDILWDQGMLRLFGKGKKERFVPVSAEQLFPLLKKWLLVRKDYATGNGKDSLFVNRAGGACDANTFQQVFRKHRIRTGLGTEGQGSLSAHTLRHYFGTMYLVNGGKIEVLQQIMGHNEITTTMNYLHLANRFGMIKDDHSKVSPLKNLDAAVAAPKKKRKMN